jgi:hypothetical protein
MEVGATISRAFNIVKNHRALWVLGFLAALAGGGSGGSFNTSGGNFGGTGSGEIPPEMQRFLDMLQENAGAIVAGVIGLVCVLFVISFILWIISLIAEGGLINGVDSVERTGGMTFGAAWRAGSSKLLPLLGLSILLALPLIAIFIVAAVLVGGSFIPLIAAAAQGSGEDALAGTAAGGTFAALCIGGSLACVGGLYSLLAAPLQTFGERAIVLDDLGVMDAIRKAWAVFRANLGNIILLAIVMLVIGFVVGLLVGLVSAAIFVPVLITGIMSGAAAQEGFNIGAGTIITAVIAFIAVAIIAAVINALVRAFSSTTWTLAYRQFTDRGLATSATSAVPPPLPTV